jgi:hypothetical protein
MHAPMHCFQNGLAYFATAVIYNCKMFMKLTPGRRSHRIHRWPPPSQNRPERFEDFEVVL